MTRRIEFPRRPADPRRRREGLSLLAGSLVAGYILSLTIVMGDSLELADLLLPFQAATLKLVALAAAVAAPVAAVAHRLLVRFGRATLVWHAAAGAIVPVLVIAAFRATFGPMDDPVGAALFQGGLVLAGVAGGAVYHLVWRML